MEGPRGASRPAEFPAPAWVAGFDFFVEDGRAFAGGISRCSNFSAAVRTGVASLDVGLVIGVAGAMAGAGAVGCGAGPETAAFGRNSAPAGACVGERESHTATPARARTTAPAVHAWRRRFERRSHT